MSMTEAMSLRDQQYSAMKAAKIKVEGEAVLVLTFTALGHGFALSSQMMSNSTMDSFLELNELYMWGIRWATKTGILSDESVDIIRESQLDPPLNPLLWGSNKFVFEDSNLNYKDAEALQNTIYQVLLTDASKCKGKSGELQKRRKVLIKVLKKYGKRVQDNDPTDALLFSLCTSYGLIVGDTFIDIYGDRPARRDAGAFWTSILLTQWLGNQIARSEIKS
jgi:hypothetical protein